MRNRRKGSLLITSLNLVFIILFIVYINNYVLNIREKKVEGLKYKFKYEMLKDSIGFIYYFYIENNSGGEKQINIKEPIKFFMEDKKNKPFWNHIVEKPNFPVIVNKKSVNQLILKKNDMINYLYIFEFQKEKTLSLDDYFVGIETKINTNQINLKLPFSTKPKKGFEKLFK